MDQLNKCPHTREVKPEYDEALFQHLSGHFVLSVGASQADTALPTPSPHPGGMQTGWVWLDTSPQALHHVVLHELGRLHHDEFRGDARGNAVPQHAEPFEEELSHHKRFLRPPLQASVPPLPFRLSR